MKHTRKILSLLLALVMVLALATTALAANENPHSIVISNDKTGHTYAAYQVFKGDYTGGYLTNVEWGDGVNGDALLTALKAANNERYKDCNSAADVADVLRQLKDDDKLLNTFAKIVNENLTATVAGSTSTSENGEYKINVKGDGYYLVKDAADLPDHDAATRFILEVAGLVSIDVTPKSDVPEVKKIVDEVNDSQEVVTGGGDSASYDIGDEIQFHLRATLPSNVDVYEAYKIVFKDKLSAGLTFNKASVKVWNATQKKEVTANFKVSDPAEGEEGYQVVTITCDDVKGFAVNGDVIRVDYTATLNDNAVIGNPGNPNMVSLEFSNDPYSDHMGKTPEDKVVVFTYKVIINKTQPGGTTGKTNPLAGAAFKLEKQIAPVNEGDEPTYVPVKEFTVDPENPATSFEFKGLDAGIYKLTETVTPDGFNSIDPITFQIVDTRDTDKDDPALTDIKGKPIDGTIVFTPNVGEGSLTAEILNKQGATLPTTGGIGTTIFYVVGVVLILGAGVLLITKKRSAKQ